MQSSVSPYALLKASKPKPVPTIVTPYDLYSSAYAQHTDASPASDSPDLTASDAPHHQSPQRRVQAYPNDPSRRTHYISDIHSRHNQAIRQSSRIHSF